MFSDNPQIIFNNKKRVKVFISDKASTHTEIQNGKRHCFQYVIHNDKPVIMINLYRITCSVLNPISET